MPPQHFWVAPSPAPSVECVVRSIPEAGPSVHLSPETGPSVHLTPETNPSDAEAGMGEALLLPSGGCLQLCYQFYQYRFDQLGPDNSCYMYIYIYIYIYISVSCRYPGCHSAQALETAGREVLPQGSGVRV